MRRELNEIEYLNWCFGQPYNIVVAVRMRGDVSSDRLQSALDKAQQRHPLLKVNTILDERGVPWFASESVSGIPLTVLQRAGEDHALHVTEKELATPFEMDKPLESRPPLARVTLLRPQDTEAESSDVIISVQHTVTDGMSMVFLVRDLLFFMTNPERPVAVLDVTASTEDIFPLSVRKRVPKSKLKFEASLRLMKFYHRLRFRHRTRKSGVAMGPSKIYSWQFSGDETRAFLARCKEEQVSVQSALCASFLTTFTAVDSPVNLRARLALPVGEAFGLFAGAAVVKMKYNEKRDFWDNARRFHRKLGKSLRDPFSVFRLFSKAVPLKAVQEYAALLADLMSGQHPFAITNLGSLDRLGISFQMGDLRVESFFGSVASFIDASVLTVYTVDGVMHFHIHYRESSTSTDEIEKLTGKAMDLMRSAIAQPINAGSNEP